MSLFTRPERRAVTYQDVWGSDANFDASPGDFATFVPVFAAVRLIAVDFRFPISDRDPEIGYVLFSYRDAGREHNGSLELARTTGVNGTPQVRVTMQVPSMPGYVERMLLDRLSRKLTEDYGRPPPTRRPEPPAPPVADDDEDDDDAADTDAPSED